MSQIDYEELIRSPLDAVDGGGGSGLGIAVLGAVIGAGLGLLFSVGLGDQQPQVEPTAPAVATATVVPVATVPDYPAGYAEISPGYAVAATELVVDDEMITVGMATAVRRGEDFASAAWPVGGTWVLESESGAVVESARVVVARFSPAVFSVHFPAAAFNGETEFSELRLLERWDREPFTASVELPFAGDPFIAEEPISTSVNQDTALIIPTLRLGRFIGTLHWQTSGADLGTTVQVSASLFDADGEFIGSYERFGEFIEPASEGVVNMFWSEPFPIDQEGAVSVSIEYTVGVVRSVPTTLSIDLNDVPVGR